MSEQRVTLEVRGRLLLIGLNRPEKMNAADIKMLEELSLAYGELERNKEVWVGVVFAHGDHFTAGLDLNDVAPRLGPNGLRMVPEGGIDPWGIQTASVSKPVVLAISGTCLTLGVELALNSEIVIAAANSRFAQLEVARGILPFGGATKRLPRMAGWQRAMRYLLSGDFFDALTARELGVVTEVVPDGEQLTRAIELAEKIASNAPLAVFETLASARAALLDEVAEDRALGQRLAKLAATSDARAAMAAYLTKGEVNFEGR